MTSLKQSLISPHPMRRFANMIHAACRHATPPAFLQRPAVAGPLTMPARIHPAAFLHHRLPTNEASQKRPVVTRKFLAPQQSDRYGLGSLQWAEPGDLS